MTPQEISNKSFTKSMSGYKPDEVQRYLIEVAEYVRGLLREQDEVLEKMEVLAEKLEEYRADDESLRAALIGAQKLGDSVVREAKSKAQSILDDAKRKADEIVGNASRNIELESFTLEKKKLEAAKFKSQLLNMYKQHIDLINSLPYDEDAIAVPKPPMRESRAEEPRVQEAPVRQEEPETFDDGVVRLDYEEVREEEDGASKRKSRFGTLRFGEAYDLKRDE